MCVCVCVCVRARACVCVCMCACRGQGAELSEEQHICILTPPAAFLLLDSLAATLVPSRQEVGKALFGKADL